MSLTEHSVAVLQVGDSSCREMWCRLGANQPPDTGTLLKTRQVTEVQERKAPSTHSPVYNSPAPPPVHLFLLPFTLIDRLHPIITSRPHHFHPLAAIVSLSPLLLSAEFPFSVLLSFNISPSHLCPFFISPLCFAPPPASPPPLSRLPPPYHPHPLSSAFKPLNLPRPLPSLPLFSLAFSTILRWFPSLSRPLLLFPVLL